MRPIRRVAAALILPFALAALLAGCGETKPGEEAHTGHSSTVILDFGGQLKDRSGTLSLNTEEELPFKNKQIEEFAEEFSYWYYACTGEDRTTVLTLGIGTNNSWKSVSKAGGKAWATVVKTVAAHVLERPGVSAQVSIWGASDLENEAKWSSGSAAHSWAVGYGETTESDYFDFGDAGACPQTTHTNGECRVVKGPGGWDQQLIYELSWELPRAHSTPEIYASSTADQWTQLSLYGNAHFTDTQFFRGPLDEGGSGGAGLNSTEAWDIFSEDLEEHGLESYVMSASLSI